MLGKQHPDIENKGYDDAKEKEKDFVGTNCENLQRHRKTRWKQARPESNTGVLEAHKNAR